MGAITGCCWFLSVRQGFEVLGGRFRQARDPNYDVYFSVPFLLRGRKKERFWRSHCEFSLLRISPCEKDGNVLFGSFPEANIPPSDWYSATVRFKISQRAKGLESGETGRVGNREWRTQQRGCIWEKDEMKGKPGFFFVVFHPWGLIYQLGPL